MTALEKHLITYFDVAEVTDLEKIANQFKTIELKKGDYFLKAGSTADQLAFVQSGLLRVFSFTEEKEITQWIAQDGYFITDLSAFIFEKPSRWNIQALTDVRLYSIGKSDYSKLGETVSNWKVFETAFITRCFATMEDRIFSHLSMSAEERYNHFFEHNKALFNAVPLQYIASMLGMTPETFSRIRKK